MEGSKQEDLRPEKEQTDQGDRQHRTRRTDPGANVGERQVRMFYIRLGSRRDSSTDHCSTRGRNSDHNDSFTSRKRSMRTNCATPNEGQTKLFCDGLHRFGNELSTTRVLIRDRPLMLRRYFRRSCKLRAQECHWMDGRSLSTVGSRSKRV